MQTFSFILGTYLSVTSWLAAASTGCSVFVVAIYHKDPDEALPAWIIKLNDQMTFWRIIKKKYSNTDKYDLKPSESCEQQDVQTVGGCHHSGQKQCSKTHWKELSKILDYMFVALFILLYFIVQVTFLAIGIS